VLEHNLDELTFEDYLRLFTETDLQYLLSLADKVRRRFCGKTVTFVNNLVVNYSNICVARCPICAFARGIEDPDAYTLKPDEVAKLVEEAYYMYGISEVHLNGGLNPELDVEYFEEMFRLIKKRTPYVRIKGLTCCEIGYYSKLWRMSYRETIERLRDAGLDVLSGGCLEMYNNDVRKIITPNKISAEEWFKIAELASKCGVLTNATILFGHVEKPEHVIEHLLKIREFQDKTKSILIFIPLKYSPWNTELYKRGIVKDECSSEYVLRVIAISRIILGDRVKRIAAYWVSIGKKLAQIALTGGANDLVGTMLNERVFRETGRRDITTIEELAKMVRDAGYQPALRDTYGNIVRIL